MEAREINLSQISNITFTKEHINVYDLCVQDNHNYCITDNNTIVHNSGKSVVQMIRRSTDLNIIESTAPKDDKLTRVHIVSPKIEAGRVAIHQGSWNETFIGQLTSFPNAEHDDEVDCLVAVIMREVMTQSADNSIKYFNF